MKTIINILYSLAICAITATALAVSLDIDPQSAMLGCAGVSVVMSFFPMPAGATAVVLKQMWETALIEAFRASRNWSNRLLDKSSYVGNNVINITEIGADPTVLINNTSYPIASAQRTDDNIAVGLNKYDTENTLITRDELYALPYAKEGSVVDQHRKTLTARTGEHGLHTLCVSGDTANTPVLETTGPDDGNGRARLITKDLIRFKQALDNLNAPRDRVLVLNPDHVADLLIEDLTFQQRYQGVKDGMIAANYYGFEIYEDTYAPLFNSGGAKKAFGSSSVSGDRKASVCFLPERAFKAMGTLELYYADATQNPAYRRTELGYRMWMVMMPLKNTAFGAIISANI